MNFLDIYFKVLRKMQGNDLSNSVIDPSSKVEAGSRVLGSTMHRHSFCGYNCTLINVDLGSFCSLANNVSIGGAKHPLTYLSTSPVFLSHKDSVRAKFASHDYLPIIRTVIGNDVWIGESCIIKAGVTIGHGAVIGMGAVVTKDVPPYAIVAGNPAKLIRMRFEADVVNALLKWQWWNLSEDELRRIGPSVSSPERLLLQEGLL